MADRFRSERAQPPAPGGTAAPAPPGSVAFRPELAAGGPVFALDVGDQDVHRLGRSEIGRGRQRLAAQRRLRRPAQWRSDQSLPPVAQFSRLMSVIRMSTASGDPPSTCTLTRVISSTSFFFCSTVRPSIISMWYVGMADS